MSTDKSTSAMEASNELNDCLRHSRAIADLLMVADSSSFADDTIGDAGDLLFQQLKAAQGAANTLWGCYLGRGDTIKTLEQQLREIADAKELLAKRDRLRELLGPWPSKEGLHAILKPDEGE